MKPRAGGYRISREVRLREFGDELVIVHIEKEFSCSLNGVGAILIRTIQRGETVADAALLVAAEYEVERQVAYRDLEKLTAELMRAGVLVEEPGSPD